MPPTTQAAAPTSANNAEQNRLQEASQKLKRWRRWGTYLSERQWGTVREDYSADGSAWDYFSHDQARSRAYRWGEDGIAGFCDEKETLCVALALWNGNDPILKERLFGLTNGQGNHGEDVKELYYYLDATPTCSYARTLYKYPQAAFPYQQLVDENARRGLLDPEFELMDTGIFNDNRYFDIFVEYAKADEEDILLRVTVYNRGPEASNLVLLPQVWYRNTWSWGRDPTKPSLTLSGMTVQAQHPSFGNYQVAFDPPQEFLFCDNETNVARVFGGNETPGHFKDAFHDYVIRGIKDAVNPEHRGTKAAALYRLNLAPGSSSSIRLRLRPPSAADNAFDGFDQVFADRIREADEFYAGIHSGIDSPDARMVQRQALAGMLWNRQCYHYNVFDWLQGDPGQPPPPEQRKTGRNNDWGHLNADEVLSMPDKWEYPWFAAWDLGFHCVALSLVDPEFAKHQLVLLGREWYMQPDGQFPAYEWNFSDVNPPVHAIAAWRIYRLEQLRNGGKGDRAFLERMFLKLMINFTWWVNRLDEQGRNIFQGGFLGLDNIGVFDRSVPLPDGGCINQSDGTAWMAMYALNLMRIALELAKEDYIYQDVASKFFEHFLYIARAMSDIAGQGIGLWDEEDSFYYSVLSLPDGQNIPLRTRSMVGLIPLFAVEVIEQELMDSMPHFQERLEWFLEKRPDLASLVSRWTEPGVGSRRLLSLARAFRMKKILARMLDENEFLSPYGIRALSRYHLDHPYKIDLGGTDYVVHYDPAESTSRMYGGNSNWRGPVWMPANYLIVESLRRMYDYYGDDFKVECPTGSGNYLTLWEIAEELASRLMRLCLLDENGKRVSLGDNQKLQTDPNFRDYLQFFEYFHGDSGRGMGANHQTGWTGLIANLIAEHGRARSKNPAA